VAGQSGEHRRVGSCLPAAAWLHRDVQDPLLLAAQDRGQLPAAVRAKMRGAATRVAFALPLDGQDDLTP
jgi:hypothetical protein